MKTEDKAKKITRDIDKYYDAVDVGFSRQVITDLMSFESCKGAGFRLAGSSSELAAADYLYKTFKSIGLQNVRKDEVTVDSFEFRGARLRFSSGGSEYEAELAAFQTNCRASDEDVEIVYVGKGRDTDYKDIDISGKIALVDIDQMNEWWINWPAYQAWANGAKAVIAVNTSGFCSYSEETVGVQDYCGPSFAVAFAMSVRDANTLKSAIGGFGRSIHAKLDSDAAVTHDCPAYNIVGEIPGRTDEYIYYIAHYDAYFRGFNDNSSGVACMLGIARALVQSGYRPRRTLRVVAHCAEEWGIDNSRHDWARGAQLETEKHPEWAESGFAAINLDCGLVSGKATGVLNRTQYEMADIVSEMGSDIKGNTIGPVKVESPSWTWSENYAYTNLGIPVIDCGIEGDDEMPYYHSNSDTEEACNYSEAAFLASHKIYGSYFLALDRMAVRQFDFAKTFTALKESLDKRYIRDFDALSQAADEACRASNELKAASCREFSDAEAFAFNRKTGHIFKMISNRLFGIDWDENNDFAHVHKQNNVSLLSEAISCLERGDAETVLSECLPGIDLNWYAYSFDKKTCDFFADQVLAPDARNSWGQGITEIVDLYDVIRSLQDRTDGRAGGGGDTGNFDSEIQILKKELVKEQERLDRAAAKELQDIREITKLI